MIVLHFCLHTLELQKCIREIQDLKKYQMIEFIDDP